MDQRFKLFKTSPSVNLVPGQSITSIEDQVKKFSEDKMGLNFEDFLYRQYINADPILYFQRKAKAFRNIADKAHIASLEFINSEDVKIFLSGNVLGNLEDNNVWTDLDPSYRSAMKAMLTNLTDIMAEKMADAFQKTLDSVENRLINRLKKNHLEV